MMQVFWVEGVLPGRLGFSARPRANDRLDDELRGARSKGVDVLVSLLEASEASELGLSDEDDAAGRAGLDFWSFPIPDRQPPEDTEAADRFAQRLHSAVMSGQGVVVHCRMGIGRSSLMAGTVLVLSGATSDEAWARLSRARGTVVPDTFVQKTWLDEFARRRHHAVGL